MKQIRHLDIYMEATPNPASMKFVTDRLLLKNGSVEYLSKEEARNCPMAAQLFDFSGVRSVFISSNFVSVNKTEDLEWIEIQSIVREFIRSYILSEEAIFTSDELIVQTKEQSVAAKVDNGSNGSPEVVEKIKELLEEFVRPAVEKDGGAIEFGNFIDGVVTLDLKGACSGCPSSVVTLKNGIENLLTLHVPEVRSVVARDA